MGRLASWFMFPSLVVCFGLSGQGLISADSFSV